MPPVRVVSPSLEKQTESPKSLKEWFGTEETVRGLYFNKQVEESIIALIKVSPIVLSVMYYSTIAG